MQKNISSTILWVTLFLFIGLFTGLFIGVLLFAKNIEKSMPGWPIDIARRVTSPNGSNTAILVRLYGFDLNFALYITDDNFADITDSEEDASFISDNEFASLTDAVVWIRRALWISHDYDPDTGRNWREDVVWSEEGAVVAVTIEGQYVFAYDVLSGQQYEDPQQIRDLLERI